MSPTETKVSATAQTEPAPWVDRLMRIVIFGGGALVLALLAWGHLGLGALIHPPAPTALQQTAQAGPYAITFIAPSQMSARSTNVATFTLHSATGAPLANTTVKVQLTMLDMPMSAPDAVAIPQGDGSYLAHPLFAMAGSWRMTVVVTTPGQPTQHTDFTVSVRWT